jgi:hypothetical protein
MSFTAITLCIASQPYLFMCLADLKEQCIYIKFSLKHAKFALVTCEMIKTAFDGNTVGRTQDF